MSLVYDHRKWMKKFIYINIGFSKSFFSQIFVRKKLFSWWISTEFSFFEAKNTYLYNLKEEKQNCSYVCMLSTVNNLHLNVYLSQKYKLAALITCWNRCLRVVTLGKATLETMPTISKRNHANPQKKKPCQPSVKETMPTLSKRNHADPQ